VTYFIADIELRHDQTRSWTHGRIEDVGITYYAGLGHVVGQCYKCPDQPIVYLNTPKCASSFMKTQLLNLGWQLRFLQLGKWVAQDPTEMLPLDEVEKIIVVMRDPYDRWLSGMAEYFGEYFDDSESVFEYLDNPLTKHLISQQVAFDDHTESQLFFLQNVPLHKCIFFRQEEGLNYKISEYLREHLNIPNDVAREKPVHVSTAGSYNGRVKRYLDRLLRKDSVHYLKVLTQMEQDYEFIENMVKFYGD